MSVLKTIKRENAPSVFRFLVGFFALLAVMGTTPGYGKPDLGKDDMNSLTNLLFIHHSCGGTLLADPGPQSGGQKGSGNRCIYGAHPNGGGLRSLLEENSYQVNELSYESRLGEDTDIQHWRKKFSDHMDELLQIKNQDETLPEGQSNSIVVFKSCYPNNDYVGLGTDPGDPDSDLRTVANSKAAYNSLLPLFKQNPEVLFVAFTAPPRAKPKPVGFKEKVLALFRKNPKDADFARVFNSWLANRENGWLKEYDLPNVVVFDYYDILTGNGESNWSRFPTQNGFDSHPNEEGNQIAARAFLSLLKNTHWKRN